MKEFRSNYEGWPTTRCYPRTIEEAYPNDPSRAEWFYKPERKRNALEYAMLSAAFWIFLGICYWWSNQ
jgi:hypothetical protein